MFAYELYRKDMKKRTGHMTGKKNKIAPYDILLHMYFCNFVESQFGLGSVVLIAVSVISFGLSLQCCKGCIVCCLVFWV